MDININEAAKSIDMDMNVCLILFLPLMPESESHNGHQSYGLCIQFLYFSG